MSGLDASKVSIVPYVSLADTSVQDHSTADRQFPGVYNDALFLWAMVDTEDGKRYELIRELSASAAFDFNLHECSTDLWTHPRNVRFPGEHDLYWGLIMWFEREGKQIVYPAHA
jgi:hypothetical protein